MLTLETVAEFTWDFGQEFFLQTEYGNYIWSDPRYKGNNTIRPTELSYEEWIGKGNFGRSKGKHLIGLYCGQDVKIIQ